MSPVHAHTEEVPSVRLKCTNDIPSEKRAACGAAAARRRLLCLARHHWPAPRPATRAAGARLASREPGRETQRRRKTWIPCRGRRARATRPAAPAAGRWCPPTPLRTRRGGTPGEGPSGAGTAAHPRAADLKYLRSSRGPPPAWPTRRPSPRPRGAPSTLPALALALLRSDAATPPRRADPARSSSGRLRLAPSTSK